MNNRHPFSQNTLFVFRLKKYAVLKGVMGYENHLFLFCNYWALSKKNYLFISASFFEHCYIIYNIICYIICNLDIEYNFGVTSV